MGLKKRLFDPGKPGAVRDFGLLLVRLGFAVTLVWSHGWGKLVHFAERSGRFPDPLGLGSEASLGLAVFAEVFCAAALAIGFMGRLATIPLVVMFGVAFFLIHGTDPFADKELAWLYLLAFAGLLAAGPGRFSLDHLLRKG